MSLHNFLRLFKTGPKNQKLKPWAPSMGAELDPYVNTKYPTCTLKGP